MPQIAYDVLVRLAAVRKVGRTYIDFEFIDKIDNQVYRVPSPQPYAGRGGGVLVGIEKDSIILVSKGHGEKWYCVATLPDHSFFFDLDGASDLRFDETPYPELQQGEVCIKGNTGNEMFFLSNGNIRIDSGAGKSSGDMEFSRSTETLFTRVKQNYIFNEAGRSIEGLIRRNVSLVENEIDTKTRNFLDSESYDQLLKSIGRFVKNRVDSRTTTSKAKGLKLSAYS